jgi:hypothetical protein
MGIRIEWADEAKTTILHIYEGKWTLDDYYGLIRENYNILTQIPHTVDVINDLREAGPVPSGMASAVKYAARKAPSNEGIKIIVGANKFVKSLIDLINVTAGDDVTNVMYVATIEEAFALVNEHQAKRTVSS